MSEEFDWQKRSKEYNERNNIIFKGDINDKREFDTFFNTLYQPKNEQNIGILGEKYLNLLQEKNKSEKRPEGQFLIDPDLVRDVLDCMGYDRTDVIKYKAYGDLLCDQIFDYAVDKVSKQQNPNILFLTGNPAAGKGHALKDESISAELDLNGHSIIYDSPMADFKWGSKQIKELIDKNFKVDYVQIYNDFQTSYKNMIDRGLKEGRFVDFNYFKDAFEFQKNRTFDIINGFKQEMKVGQFRYKGIDCSENIIRDQTLNLRNANGEFIYKIKYEDLNKCYDYGRQRLQGLERGSELRRHIATGGSDDARRISTDKITAQLRDISVYVLVWLHNQQLRQSPRTTEESIRETERRTFEKDRNESLGLESKTKEYLITSDILKKIDSIANRIPLAIKEVDGKAELTLNMFSLKGEIDPSVKKEFYFPKTALSSSGDTVVFVGDKTFSDKNGEIGNIFNVDIKKRLQEKETNYASSRIGEVRVVDKDLFVSLDPIKAQYMQDSKNNHYFCSVYKDGNNNLFVYPSRKNYANSMTNITNFYIDKEMLLKANNIAIKIDHLNGKLYMGNSEVGSIYKKKDLYVEADFKTLKNEVHKNKKNSFHL